MISSDSHTHTSGSGLGDENRNVIDTCEMYTAGERERQDIISTSYQHGERERETLTRQGGQRDDHSDLEMTRDGFVANKFMFAYASSVSPSLDDRKLFPVG